MPTEPSRLRFFRVPVRFQHAWQAVGTLEASHFTMRFQCHAHEIPFLGAMGRVKSFLKRCYAALPYKQPAYTVLRSIVSVPEPIHRHLHFTGVISVAVGKHGTFRIMHHGDLIENELFWQGLSGWEKVSIELWVRLCEHANMIIDIGANTGVYALVAKTVNQEALVVAVEPVERVFRKLEANIALNGGGIRAFRAAASNRTGTAILYDTPAREHVLSVSLEQDWNANSPELQPVEVPCITVADIMGKVGASKVDVLKIDVETHEPAVLGGFVDILRRDRPAMLIELLNDEVASKVEALVDGLGYAYYNIDEVTWPPVQVQALTKSNHFNFLLCTPETARSIGL